MYEEHQSEQCLIRCREAGAAERWGEAADWAKLGLQNPKLSLRVEGELRLRLGTALIRVDPCRAETEFRTFLKLSENCPELQAWKHNSYYNLGHVLQVLQRPREDLPCLLAALSLIEPETPRTTFFTYGLAFVWASLLAGLTRDARPVLEAMESSVRPDDTFEEALGLPVARVLYLFTTGEVGEAGVQGQRLWETRGAMPPKYRGDLAWVLGRIALAQNDAAAALAWAERAETEALKDWWPPQLGRITDLKRTIVLD